MNLVFIYGPPAAGKLTVAKEVCSLTGYKLFHGHLTYDLANSIFEHGTKEFYDYCDRLRLDGFETAAKARIPGMVFTFCYACPQDNYFIANVVSTLRKHDGEVLFVHLCCNKETLFERVVTQSRQQTNKLKTVEGLRGVLEKWNLFEDVPSEKNLSVDNSEISAQEIARKIVDHFGLGEKLC